jgi:hypothetical protein
MGSSAFSYSWSGPQLAILCVVLPWSDLTSLEQQVSSGPQYRWSVGCRTRSNAALDLWSGPAYSIMYSSQHLKASEAAVHLLIDLWQQAGRSGISSSSSSSSAVSASPPAAPVLQQLHPLQTVASQSRILAMGGDTSCCRPAALRWVHEWWWIDGDCPWKFPCLAARRLQDAGYIVSNTS